MVFVNHNKLSFLSVEVSFSSTTVYVCLIKLCLFTNNNFPDNDYFCINKFWNSIHCPAMTVEFLE